MANDTTGFRSLVEQIQQRDREAVPAVERPRARASERSEKTERPARRREAATAAERAVRRDDLPAFLTRRWL
jgi:hypothetical protein